MSNPRKTLFLLTFAAAVSSAAALAQQQTTARPIESLAISVVDPATGREVASLGRADALEIELGQELRLEVVDSDRTRREGRHVPATFELVGSDTGLRLVRQDASQGTVVVRAQQPPGGSREPQIGWRIPASVKLANENLRFGRVEVDVVGSTETGSIWQPTVADRVVAALYRGILLREPEAGAVTQHRTSLVREGLDGTARLAREIAESRESEIGVYEKGTCNQQRLLALYRHLLGRDASGVDQARWREQLRSLERGDVAVVVDQLVRTREFRDHLDLS